MKTAFECGYCGKAFYRDAAPGHNRPIRFCCLPCFQSARNSPGYTWTANHTALLLAVAESATDAETAELLGRTKRAVVTVRRRFGLRKPPTIPVRRFTAGEDALMADLYPHVSSSDLALLLDRTQRSIDSRARKLGLTKTVERLIAAGHTHRLLPPEVRELIALNSRIKRKLREKHS